MRRKSSWWIRSPSSSLVRSGVLLRKPFLFNSLERRNTLLAVPWLLPPLACCAFFFQIQRTSWWSRLFMLSSPRFSTKALTPSAYVLSNRLMLIFLIDVGIKTWQGSITQLEASDELGFHPAITKLVDPGCHIKVLWFFWRRWAKSCPLK